MTQALGNRKPVEDTMAQTHWEGCWREHHACAISELTAIDRIMQGVGNTPDAPNGLRDRIRRIAHGKDDR